MRVFQCKPAFSSTIAAKPNSHSGDNARASSQRSLKRSDPGVTMASAGHTSAADGPAVPTAWASALVELGEVAAIVDLAERPFPKFRRLLSHITTPKDKSPQIQPKTDSRRRVRQLRLRSAASRAQVERVADGGSVRARCTSARMCSVSGQ